jgi:hypothetical protein
MVVLLGVQPTMSTSETSSDAGPSDRSDGESVSALVSEALKTRPTSAIIRTSINPYAFAISVAATFLLSRLASYLTPFKLYFSFQSFLFSTDDKLKWTSLGIKLLVPTFIGFCLFYLPHHWLSLSNDKSGSDPLVRYLGEQADLTARCSAFFAALLMAWPFIIYWDLMVPPNLNEHRVAFYFIYLLYFISYAYFSSLGVLIARWFVGEKLSEFEQLELNKTATLMEGVRTSAIGVLTSGFATYLSTNLAGAS